MEGSCEQFVGVDWGHTGHTVCVVDAQGTVVRETTVAHTGDALGAWVTALLAGVGAAPARLAVALEVPRGPVVEALLLRGIPTFSLNPKQATRLRERASAAGVKDDRRDAWLLAQGLRTDRALFRPLTLEDPLVVQLREYTHMDEELTREARRLTNQLWDVWQRYYPQLGALAPGADDPWVWRLCELASTPAAGARLRPSQVAAVLRSYRIRRLEAAAVVAILRTPALAVAPGVTDAAAAHARQLIRRLWLLRQEQATTSAALTALLAQLTTPPAGPPADSGDGPPAPSAGPSDAAILQSMPGVGPVVASRVLSEASAPLAAREYAQLRAWCGLAPVTKQSGKSRLVQMRQACSRRLRDACFFWAFGALRADLRSAAYYARLRARGHTHGRALRSVADRLLRILCTLLTTRTLYDRARFAPDPVTSTPV